MLTDKPISREILCYRLKVSDNVLREAKAELVDNNVPVCANSDKKGYWLGNAEDRRHAANELRAKAMTLLQRADKLDPDNVEGQVVMNLEV